ncbi:MAG TPA: heme-binding domain-containing protein [Gaiella sp.]|uniref:heme-binding domain-containing protein n=1 Tax=Gaiella sp. TaxID=2663207 RepID=UPI002D7E5CC6|nr:heme-binding domain-containing protein [Gaiella sp.]HET9286809.1 heme-binding domain-containing protein [Gaiella sp.]
MIGRTPDAGTADDVEPRHVRKRLIGAVVLIVSLFVVAQAVPYGRDHTNPPVRREVRWARRALASSPQARVVDCHSNLTDWTWYTNVAPVSWLVYGVVEGGREHVDFSEWDRPQ